MRRGRTAPQADAGAKTIFLPSAQSTSIRNVHPSDNPDDLLRIGEIIAEVVHVNPLWFGEFPPAPLPMLRLQEATTYTAAITSAKMQYRGPYRG